LYLEIPEFMNEYDRQSVLEHFANVCSEWPPAKKDDFIEEFDCTCNDITTVELAKRYYYLLGENVKKFLEFAMLRLPFTENEIQSCTGFSCITYSSTLSFSFIKFTQSPKDDDERMAVWTINDDLIVNLPLNQQQREIGNMINDIKLGATEAIHRINTEIICKMLEYYDACNHGQLVKWICLIWSKLKMADVQIILATSPFRLVLSWSCTVFFN